ncbi:hypothetical protein ADIS_2968 [Lunatimonas lonarensis]|uniref:Uncharacterized protein n=1 Tax=Lunatimonas lonarensis TaxID=1232681 RepID=R7ZR33_9BACT|nr:hypothetical protein ADIS_2968 [Lunatimonas lonarensis]
MLHRQGSLWAVKSKKIPQFLKLGDFFMAWYANFPLRSD